MNPKEASEKSKRMLDDLQSGRVTLAEHLTECAYWAVREGFDELVPRSFPIKPPMVVELEKKSAREKEQLDWPKTYSLYPEVKDYYEQRKHVENWNRNTQAWLKEMLDYIPVTDYPTREKINKRLLEFQDETLIKIKDTFDAKTM